MRRIIKKVYHKMQHHYITFRILVFLKEHGVTRRINHIVRGSNYKQTRVMLTDEMKKSLNFYMENQDRITNVMNLLADEKSRKVWDGVMKYRMHRTPIAPELYSENDQYFVKDLLQISPNEIFIDGGAYTGDTIQQFMDMARKQKIDYKKIIAFEPDERNYELLSRYYGHKEKVILVKKGIYKEDGILYFKDAGAAASIVDNEEDASYQIPVTSIDKVSDCNDATWIKMDIEGAEMDALYGAKEVIKRNHPKLTICIYHSDRDMLGIIEYIHELVPEYKLYVRHHSRSNVETVLYAI